MKSLSRVKLFVIPWSLPGSSVHGILQARILEWVAISFSRGYSRPRNRTQFSCIAGRHFTIWATREFAIKLTVLHSFVFVFPIKILPIMKPIILIQNVVLERTLERSLTSKEIKPVNRKGNQSWMFIWKTDAEAEAPILWPPDAKSPLIGKYPGSGKDWRQKEKRAENEMVEWHHQLNGHEFEQILGDGEGQGGLACCSSWGHKESDTTLQLNSKSEFSLYSIQHH